MPGAKEFQEPLPPPATPGKRGRKRKNQEEVAAAVEEDARLERERTAAPDRTPTLEPTTPLPEDRMDTEINTPAFQVITFGSHHSVVNSKFAVLVFAIKNVPKKEFFLLSQQVDHLKWPSSRIVVNIWPQTGHRSALFRLPARSMSLNLFISKI